MSALRSLNPVIVEDSNFDLILIWSQLFCHFPSKVKDTAGLFRANGHE